MATPVIYAYDTVNGPNEGTVFPICYNDPTGPNGCLCDQTHGFYQCKGEACRMISNQSTGQYNIDYYIDPVHKPPVGQPITVPITVNEAADDVPSALKIITDDGCRDRLANLHHQLTSPQLCLRYRSFNTTFPNIDIADKKTVYKIPMLLFDNVLHQHILARHGSRGIPGHVAYDTPQEDLVSNIFMREGMTIYSPCQCQHCTHCE